MLFEQTTGKSLSAECAAPNAQSPFSKRRMRNLLSLAPNAQRRMRSLLFLSAECAVSISLAPNAQRRMRSLSFLFRIYYIISNIYNHEYAILLC